MRAVLHPKGFTLIELLAAMMAGALLLVWLGWTVGSIGERAQQGVAQPPHEALLEAWPAIAAQVEAAYFVEEAADAEQLLVMAPLSLGFAQPAALSFAVGPDERGRRALRAEYSDPATAMPLAPPAVLVRGFTAIAVFHELAADGQRPVLRFAFTDSKGGVVTLSARPQSNASPACRFDTISLACRP